MDETLLLRTLDRRQKQLEELELLIAERTRSLDAVQVSLQQTNRFLGNVLGALRCAVFVVDGAGTIVRANDAAARLLGRELASLVGLPIVALMPPEQAGQPLPTEKELELVARDGSRVAVLFAASPLVGDDGTALGQVCIAYDMRDKKRLEIELRHAQKLESVGQLASGIAHEINTPVQFAGDSIAFLGEACRDVQRVLASYKELAHAVTDAADLEAAAAAAAAVEAVETEVDMPLLMDEMPAAIQRAGEGTQRIATIVRAMKAFAHPGDSGIAANDVNAAIRNTLEVCRNEYKYVAEVALELGELPKVQCILGDFNQVVLNLVVNAAHAIETVVAGSGRRGRITVRTRVDGADAVLEVEDTGTGIPQHVADRIFEPFFTTKPVGKGTGQGLAIARNIVVDRHGGTLTFESAVGRGTTFRVRMPIAGKGARA